MQPDHPLLAALVACRDALHSEIYSRDDNEMADSNSTVVDADLAIAVAARLRNHVVEVAVHSSEGICLHCTCGWSRSVGFSTTAGNINQAAADHVRLELKWIEFKDEKGRSVHEAASRLVDERGVTTRWRVEHRRHDARRCYFDLSNTGTRAHNMSWFSSVEDAKKAALMKETQVAVCS